MTGPTCVANLRDHQTQLDADGCMVAVSRQALDETLALVDRMFASLCFVRESLVAHGTGSCGRFCEADVGPEPEFLVEIAYIDAAGGPHVAARGQSRTMEAAVRNLLREKDNAK